MALELTGMMKAKAMVDTADAPSILIALLPAPLVTVVMPNVAKVDHMTLLLVDLDVPTPSFGTVGKHSQTGRRGRSMLIPYHRIICMPCVAFGG